jgi:hypothetical protein
VAPGEVVRIKVGFRHASAEDAAARAAIEGLAFGSLWLMCTFGGVGARTRRGFGGLRIVEATRELPGPWQAGDSVLTPGLGYYESLSCLPLDGALASSGEWIRTLAPGTVPATGNAWEGKRSSFPVLGEVHTKAATSGGEAFENWKGTLIHAGEQFRHFRADRDNSRARYRPARETREWANVVHGNSDHFALGALGLPVGYKEGYIVNADRGNEPPLRRASPLWLRAVGEKDHWRLLSFAFRSEFLPGPEAPGVHLWHNRVQGKELRIEADDVARLTDQWISVLAEDNTFVDARAEDGTDIDGVRRA